MALDEVMDYHLFAGNPVVDEIGVRAYLGAPLIDHTGTLGTICVVDTKPHNWGRTGNRIHQSAGRRAGRKDRAES